jgi:hypothetical protein
MGMSWQQRSECDAQLFRNMYAEVWLTIPKP